jgi:hypothetical protein
MDDDYYDPSFLENRVRLLEECPDALLVFSGYRRVDSDGGNQGQIRPICQDRQTYDGLNLLRIFLLEGGVFVGAMLYRREPVLRLWEGLERYDLVVDYALNLSLAMLPNARGVFCEALDFNMCIHKGQTFQTSNGCVYGLVEQVLRDQLTNIKAEYLTVLRCAYVNLLTAWALSEARNSRSSALRHLLRASAKSPQSVSLWRRWGYILLLILGVRD